MKTFRLLSVVALLTGASLLPVRAATGETAAPPALQVRVEAPFVFDAIQQDDVADALFFRVRDGLRATHRGLEVKQVVADKVVAGEPLLTITLVHWRTTRMGDIECRFTAEYRSADGTRSLGMFEGTTSSIMRSRAFAGADFERAAEEAGRRLGRELKKQNLI